MVLQAKEDYFKNGTPMPDEVALIDTIRENCLGNVASGSGILSKTRASIYHRHLPTALQYPATLVWLCPDVYNQPNNDLATESCNASANLTLSLCPFRTSTEMVTATVMTTDYAGNFVHSTLTTVINPVGPVATTS